MDQTLALELLNILGPFDGRRIRADVARRNLNAITPQTVAQETYDDLVREMKSRNWITERWDDFGHRLVGITESGQIIREKNGQ